MPRLSGDIDVVFTGDTLRHEGRCEQLRLIPRPPSLRSLRWDFAPPRDIFDVFEMFEHVGWHSSFIDCFVAYLAGHNRPVHELLFPTGLPLEPAFSNEFAGLSTDEIALATLEQTQARLIEELPGALTARHREFLISLVTAEPAWDLMPFANLQRLPAPQWKLINLRKLKKSNPGRFSAQREELASRFADLPESSASVAP